MTTHRIQVFTYDNFGINEPPAFEFDGDLADTELLLNRIWNHYHQDPQFDDYRALEVGDRISIDDRTWWVNPRGGWTEITEKLKEHEREGED